MGSPKRSYMLRSGGHGYSNRRAPLFPPLKASHLAAISETFPDRRRAVMLSNYPRQHQIGQVGGATSWLIRSHANWRKSEPRAGLFLYSRRDYQRLLAAAAQVRCWQILLQKSFCTGDQKFSGL